ncbi:hypothetical protein T492DRAFT_866302 [Pavlovales sp. CCMP2436]|nr:hypothetical protein T492DRAFT_866302 [Pavlovales sp. CCMP2436]
MNRLVTAGTVDEKILALQSRKAEMNDRILHGEDVLASLCGSILSDLLRERMSAVTRSTAAAAAAAASAGGAGAPAAEGVKGGCELQTLAHVLASSSDGRANAPVESTSGGPADSPSDAELLEALDALLSNEKLGKLINTLVEQRRVQGASAHFETPKAVAQ